MYRYVTRRDAIVIGFTLLTGNSLLVVNNFFRTSLFSLTTFYFVME